MNAKKLLIIFVLLILTVVLYNSCFHEDICQECMEFSEETTTKGDITFPPTYSPYAEDILGGTS